MDVQHAGNAERIIIAMRAMEAPLREIVSNCGEELWVVLNNVKQGTGGYGYNAATGEYGDMIFFMCVASATRLHHGKSSMEVFQLNAERD